MKRIFLLCTLLVMAVVFSASRITSNLNCPTGKTWGTGTPPTDSITRSCTVPCTFTYGQWSTCSNGIQTRSYSTSPQGWCSGVPPLDSIQRTCTIAALPNPVTIVSSDLAGVCDTIKTFTVPTQVGVNYAWSISGDPEILVQTFDNLYPNPNKGEFTINLQTKENLADEILIQIYTIQGKLIKEYRVPNNTGGIITKNISLSNTLTGVYYISYIIGDTRKTRKFYITK